MKEMAAPQGRCPSICLTGHPFIMGKGWPHPGMAAQRTALVPAPGNMRSPQREREAAASHTSFQALCVSIVHPAAAVSQELLSLQHLKYFSTTFLNFNDTISLRTHWKVSYTPCKIHHYQECYFEIPKQVAIQGNSLAEACMENIRNVSQAKRNQEQFQLKSGNTTQWWGEGGAMQKPLV
jgi:hypothetical protein